MIPKVCNLYQRPRVIAVTFTKAPTMVQLIEHLFLLEFGLQGEQVTLLISSLGEEIIASHY